ncbi:MAG TPA: YceI family protein [Steroidobacteraceae bacterium]|nr:YceI family protein [Steroidobacteraceae bacterium]
MSARTTARHVKPTQWEQAKWGLIVWLLACPAQATELYRLSSTNTQVAFFVQHLGFQFVNARFSDINGEFVLDREGPASRVDVAVGIASLECSDPHWNGRLRSAEWLDAQRYPQMTYHSSHIELDEQRGVASGDLTLHGITRPVVLTVTLLDCPTAAHCQFAAHGRIRRSEFGLPHGFWSGGDQVDITISGSIH